MIRTLPIAKLRVERTYTPQRDLSELQQSMAEQGLRRALLVTTDYLVIDGWARLEAAQALGWSEIKCQVTNDYPTMLTYLAQEPVADVVSPLRILELYKQTSRPYGNKWALKARADFRLGKPKPKPGQPFEGEKEQRFGVRIKFNETLGIRPYLIHEYMEMEAAYRRTAEKRPDIKHHLDEVMRYVAESDAEFGPGGARMLVSNLGKTPGVEAADIMMVKWRERQANRVKFKEAADQRELERQRRLSKAVGLPPEVKPVGDVLALIEGALRAVNGLVIPDMDEETRKKLSGRAVKVRRAMTAFARDIINPRKDQGNE